MWNKLPAAFCEDGHGQNAKSSFVRSRICPWSLASPVIRWRSLKSNWRTTQAKSQSNGIASNIHIYHYMLIRICRKYQKSHYLIPYIREIANPSCIGVFSTASSNLFKLVFNVILFPWKDPAKNKNHIWTIIQRNQY